MLRHALEVQSEDLDQDGVGSPLLELRQPVPPPERGASRAWRLPSEVDIFNLNTEVVYRPSPGVARRFVHTSALDGADVVASLAYLVADERCACLPGELALRGGVARSQSVEPRRRPRLTTAP